MSQRDLAFEAVAVQGGQHAQLDQQLKAVADAQHQLAGLKKAVQLLPQGHARSVFKVAPAHNGGLGRAQIVAVQKATGKNKEVIVVQVDLGGHQVGKVHHVGPVGSGQAGGVGGFQMRIGAVAGDDQRIDRAHAGKASLTNSAACRPLPATAYGSGARRGRPAASAGGGPVRDARLHGEYHTTYLALDSQCWQKKSSWCM